MFSLVLCYKSSVATGDKEDRCLHLNLGTSMQLPNFCQYVASSNSVYWQVVYMSKINIMFTINVTECSQSSLLLFFAFFFFLIEANSKLRQTIQSWKSINLVYISAVSLSFVTQPTLGQTIYPPVVLMAKECIHIQSFTGIVLQGQTKIYKSLFSPINKQCLDWPHIFCSSPWK